MVPALPFLCRQGVKQPNPTDNLRSPRLRHRRVGEGGLSLTEVQGCRTRGERRAAHSYFDQHVIEETDGNYTTFDEGDYNALPPWMIDKIAYTVPGQMADEY